MIGNSCSQPIPGEVPGAVLSIDNQERIQKGWSGGGGTAEKSAYNTKGLGGTEPTFEGGHVPPRPLGSAPDN